MVLANFSLAEALVYGHIEMSDRQAWLKGYVKRPCLVIQVNVWEKVNKANGATITEDQMLNFWSGFA